MNAGPLVAALLLAPTVAAQAPSLEERPSDGVSWARALETRRP